VHGVLTCHPTAAAVQDLQRLFCKYSTAVYLTRTNPPPYRYLTWSRHIMFSIIDLAKWAPRITIYKFVK
jgi:hypothetical protein